jgi:hypothetical protein
MYPHERSLVKKLEGKPFAVVGVNSDDDREKAKVNIKNENLTWRWFWIGGKIGSISMKWNAHSWPTIYVLDDKGVIRVKCLGTPPDNQAFDELVEELVKAAAESREKK